MSKRLRAGLIGCGFFARNHLHAWRDLPEVELVAVCDIDPAKAEAARAEFGIAKAYADAGLMLDAERLDFIDIVTTMDSHRVLAELAASRGVGIIVQKPLAPSWEDCVAIVEACRAAGVRLMVHENFRFQAPILAVRRLISAGTIGEVTFTRVSFGSAYDVYATQPYLAKEERFIILDLGIHLLDIARVLMGEVETVYCQTQRVNPKIAGEDMATILLRHASGRASVVDCSYASQQVPDPFPQTLLHVEGTKGTLDLLDGYRLTTTIDGEVTERGIEPTLLPWAAKPWHGLQESVVNAQRQWVSAVRSDTEPETSGRDNLKTYALVMACYDSATRNEVVRPRVWAPKSP